MPTDAALNEVSEFHSGYLRYESLSDKARVIVDNYEQTLQARIERQRATDTTPADNMQLAGIFAHLQARQVPAQAQPVDEQWAGPSLPHPTEATSEQEYDDLQEGWDNWAKGIDPNQLSEGHYPDEASL